MVLTKQAMKKVIELINSEPNAVAIRMAIVGGGCSGFNYVFELAEQINEDDQLVGLDDALVIVDPMSYQYLHHAVLDYKISLEGERFVVENPDATSTCGCGSSFSMD